MVELKRNLTVNGFEREVLEAVFSIEAKYGAVLARPSEPERWGFASRPVLCRQLGLEDTEANLRKVSVSLSWLDFNGYLKRHRVCGPGNACRGATRFLLAVWTLLFVSPQMGALTNSGVSGGSGLGPEVSRVDDPEAARAAWAQGLSAFRGRGGGA